MRFLFVALTSIFLLVGCSASSKPSDNASTETDPNAASQIIGEVLSKDSSLSKWAGHLVRMGFSPSRSVEWLVSQMRAIETDKCPLDFREAYYRHYHAWANMSAQLKAEPQTFGEGVVTGILNGLSGEADGGYKSMKIARDTHSKQISSSWAEVELCAIRHGAKLTQPPSQPSSTKHQALFPLAPEECNFDAENGTVSGVYPDLPTDAIVRLLPFYTAVDPGTRLSEGGWMNYGGGVFFINHDFYYYTAARAVNIRKDCKITTTDDLFRKEIGYFVSKFGNPLPRSQFPFDYPFGQSNQSWPGFIFRTSYGTLYLEYETKSNQITNIYAVHFSVP